MRRSFHEILESGVWFQPVANSAQIRKFVNSYTVGTAAPVSLPTVWISAEGKTCNEPYTGRRNHKGTQSVWAALFRCSGTLYWGRQTGDARTGFRRLRTIIVDRRKVSPGHHKHDDQARPAAEAQDWRRHPASLAPPMRFWPPSVLAKAPSTACNHRLCARRGRRRAGGQAGGPLQAGGRAARCRDGQCQFRAGYFGPLQAGALRSLHHTVRWRTRCRCRYGLSFVRP